MAICNCNLRDRKWNIANGRCEHCGLFYEELDARLDSQNRGLAKAKQVNTRAIAPLPVVRTRHNWQTLDRDKTDIDTLRADELSDELRDALRRLPDGHIFRVAEAIDKMEYGRIGLLISMALRLQDQSTK